MKDVAVGYPNFCLKGRRVVPQLGAFLHPSLVHDLELCEDGHVRAIASSCKHLRLMEDCVSRAFQRMHAPAARKRPFPRPVELRLRACSFPSHITSAGRKRLLRCALGGVVGGVEEEREMWLNLNGCTDATHAIRKGKVCVRAYGRV